MVWWALLFLALCLVGGYAAGDGLHDSYRMGLLLLGFAAFILGYFQFFYPAVDTSPDVVEREALRLQVPPVPRRRVIAWLSAGVLCALLLLFWRLARGA